MQSAFGKLAVSRCLSLSLAVSRCLSLSLAVSRQPSEPPCRDAVKLDDAPAGEFSEIGRSHWLVVKVGDGPASWPRRPVRIGPLRRNTSPDGLNDNGQGAGTLACVVPVGGSSYGPRTHGSADDGRSPVALANELRPSSVEVRGCCHASGQAAQDSNSTDSAHQVHAKPRIR